MTTDPTLSALLQQNTREVWLLADGPESARPAPPGTPGALRFELLRIPADRIRSNLLYAAIGRDGYAQYSSWYSQTAQRELEAAQAQNRKASDPEPFRDDLPDDGRWRAHTVALEEAVEAAILEAGLHRPKYEQVGHALGAYRQALVRELVQWGREVPAWDPEQPGGGDGGNSSSGSCAPP